MAWSGRCHEVCLTDDRHGRIEGCLNFKQLMQRNRRGFKLDEIRSIINRVASCCIAFPRCRHIYRNTIRLPSLLSSLAVAIIMTAPNDAFIDFIGICYRKVPSLLLRTTAAGHWNSGRAFGLSSRAMSAKALLNKRCLTISSRMVYLC